MVLKRINSFSAAKVGGLFGVILGFIIGAFISLGALLLGGLASAAGDEAGGAFAGMIFGAGAIIILPIFYGCVMFVGVLIQTALYNVAAKWVGGIEVEVG